MIRSTGAWGRRWLKLGTIGALTLGASSVLAQATSATNASPQPAAPPPPPPVVHQPSAEAFPSGETNTIAADEQAVRGLLAQHPELGCRYYAHWSLQNEVLVACGTAGVLRAVRTSSGLASAGLQRVAGEAYGFFEQGGQIWVRTRQEQALVIGSAAGSLGGKVVMPLAPGASTPPPPPIVETPFEPAPKKKKKKKKRKKRSRKAVKAKVIAIKGLDVVIDAGSEDGLTLERHIAFDDPRAEEVALLSEDSEEHRLVVGRVVELWDHRARVRLGVNEQVRMGMPTRSTKQRLTASRRSPPRVYGLTEVKTLARPILNLGTIGGGLLTDTTVGWRSKSFHYGVAAAPVGIASSRDEGTTVPWSVYAFGGFDGQNFEAGLGLGGQTVNDTSRRSLKGSGFTFVQLLRLGSVDGLHLASKTQVAVFRSETSFSTMELEGQLAISGNSWLLVRGGGGTIGYGYGEVALRNLMHGNGGKDSFFLEVGIGGAAAFEDECEGVGRVVQFDQADSLCSSKLIGGPMVVVGGEWRL